MWIRTGIIGFILSLFSTVVMAYVSMAIPIGPWIAPTLVLCAMLLFALFRCNGQREQALALATSAGSIGGILAVACGFYFPTLYFLDKPLFASWLSCPGYFAAVVGLLSFVSGLLGFFVADLFEHTFIVKEKLAFPIGELVHKTISTQNKARKSIELVVGFFSTTVFCYLQDILGYIPKSYVIIDTTMWHFFRFPRVPLDFWPMLWALGFVTGHVIAFPLAVGIISKIVIVRPLYTYVFEKDLKWFEFILTFCSGMVLSGALVGLIKTPQSLIKGVISLFSTDKENNVVSGQVVSHTTILYGIASMAPLCIFLYAFNFSLLSQLYILIFTFVCTYQIAHIAGKIGLALMGRFATFVMVPSFFLFSVDHTQTVFIATIVGIAGGVATDVLFGRKLAHLASIDRAVMRRYQYFGLLVSCLSIGVIFWLLMSYFGLGSPELFALRAQNRFMLINSLQSGASFNYYVLIIGCVFGFLLKELKVSPMLALGGLFMPINITLGLVLGGCATLLTKNKSGWYPLCSGVYAANSVWMVGQAFFKALM